MRVEQPSDLIWQHSHMPTTQQALVFNFFERPVTTVHTGGQSLSRGYVVGQLTKACTKTIQGTLHVLAINFKPQAFNSIFKIPMDKLVEKVTDLESLIGVEGKYITEQIFTATGIEERITILNKFLHSQIKKSFIRPPNAIDHALQLVHKFAGNISIRDLAKQSYTTERTLRRSFEERVGLNPKLFSKIMRFGKVVSLIEKGVIRTWRDVPFDYGYVDQSHFIKDFKFFAGKTPKEYYPENNPYNQLLDGF